MVKAGRRNPVTFIISFHSKHHGFKALFKESLVDAHELGNECFKMINSLVPLLHAMLVESSLVGNLCLQLTIAVLEQLSEKALIEKKKKQIYKFEQIFNSPHEIYCCVFAYLNIDALPVKEISI